WKVFIFSLFFALLPDIDSHTSLIGRAFPFIAHPLERRFGHRQITHSLLVLTAIGILNWLLFPADWTILTSAYASHLFIDMLTGNLGIPLLWPFQTRFYILKIQPKSTGELFLGISIAILLLLPQANRTRSAIAALIPQEELVLAPTVTPLPTATPHTIAVLIPNVYDIQSEIVVLPGDAVSRGQLLGNLITYRQANAPSPTQAQSFTPYPTFTPQPTPILSPTPFPTADPLYIAAIQQDLEIARSLYERSVATGTPNPIYVATVASYPPQIQDRIDCIAREGQHSDTGWRCRQDLELLSQQATRFADLAAPRPVDPLDVQVALERYQDAQIAYQQAIAILTPQISLPTPIPNPTTTPFPSPTIQPTQTPIPTLPAEDLTRIRSMVDGRVLSVEISRITGNYATVEIIIDITGTRFDYPPASTDTPFPKPQLTPALITHVRDGDTIKVQFFDGRQEVIRLLDVDTPETVHPNQPEGCYGTEASQYARNQLTGQIAYIELDPQTPERDRYGRLLAHIWLDEAQTQNFNLMLLERGYARFNDFGNPGRYAESYKAAENAAISQHLGLWKVCD
ncbi:MAG: metal-dependent hydrolase, partial [Chloroflexota bacterium]